MTDESSSLLRTLVQYNYSKEASHLQSTLEAFLTHVESSIPTIWVEEEQGSSLIPVCKKKQFFGYFFITKAKKKLILGFPAQPRITYHPPASKIFIAFPRIDVKNTTHIANFQLNLAAICFFMLWADYGLIVHAKSQKFSRTSFLLAIYFKK